VQASIETVKKTALMGDSQSPYARAESPSGNALDLTPTYPIGVTLRASPLDYVRHL
jgi:hypothetical protein